MQKKKITKLKKAIILAPVEREQPQQLFFNRMPMMIDSKTIILNFARTEINKLNVGKRLKTSVD